MMSSRSLEDGLSAFLLVVSRTSMSCQVGTSTPVFTSVPFPAPLPSQASVVSIPKRVAGDLADPGVFTHFPSPSSQRSCWQLCCREEPLVSGGRLPRCVLYNTQSKNNFQNQEWGSPRWPQGPGLPVFNQIYWRLFSFFSTAPLLFSSLFNSSLLQGFSNTL